MSKLKVGKKWGRWFGDCPKCPIQDGFTVADTHKQVMKWVTRHLAQVHVVPDYIEKGKRSWYG